MPERILCMAKFNYRKRNIEGLMLSLANGSVRLYSRRQLVSEIQFEEPLLSLSFCHYKGEDNCVLGVTLTGGLSVHSLRRSSQLNLRELATGPPAEQDEPLPVPQKTKMYVEQRVREQQAPVEMHKRFQRDLQLLRLTVARAYKRSIEKALNPISAPVAITGADNSISEGSLKMTAEVNHILSKRRSTL
jgi:Bardet-Biedl syndrome 1 protein